MINFNNQVPSVYTSASRDFQYMGWLINIVLNSVKHNIDDLYNLPNTDSDSKLTELLAMTLGFKVKRNYDKKQLTALAAILPRVLKCKGTEKAIRMAAEALVMASGSLGDTTTRVVGGQVEVVLPKDLIDTALFLDLLDYILPAGMTCRIIRKTEERKTVDDIKLKHKDTLTWAAAEDLIWTYGNTKAAGLSSLYELDNSGIDEYSTANIKKSSGDTTVNTGLLGNTVIPVLDPRYAQQDNNAVSLYSTEPDGTHLKLLDINGVTLSAVQLDEEDVSLYSTERDNAHLKLLTDDGVPLKAKKDSM